MRVGTPPVNRWIQAQRAPLAPADAVPVARGREPYGVGPGRAARHPLASSTISRASMATVPAFATPDLPPIHSLFRFAARHHHEHAPSSSRVLAIPPKGFDGAVITYQTTATLP